MSKATKTMIVIATLVVSLLAVNTAFAQDDDPPAPDYPYGAHMGGAYRGSGWMSDYSTEMHAAVAEALGISVAEFETEMFENGKTLWQLADELGVDYTVVRDAMQAARTAAYEQAVADGVITPGQGNGMRARQNGASAGFAGMCQGTGTCLAASNGFHHVGGMGHGHGWNR